MNVLEAVERYRNEPFVWGRHDCVRFVGAVVEELTGVDLLKGWRKRYRTEIGALRVLAAEGGLECIADASPFFVAKPVLSVAPGDVVLALLPEPTLGVSCGHLAAFAGKEGLRFSGVGSIIRAWGVPCRK